MTRSGLLSLFDQHGILPTPQRVEIAGILLERPQHMSAEHIIDKLKAAFADIYATMDMMADYKVKALDNMQQTVKALSDEVEKSKTHLDRIRKEEAAAGIAEAELVASDQVRI